jgi:ribosomal protein S18 acetylase RimI-like enzyme
VTGPCTRFDPAAIALRDATPADLSFLLELFASVRMPELAASGWTEAQKRVFCERQYALQDRHYREHFAGARCLVVEAASTPVGRLYRATVGDTLYLLDIALVERARGQGIGTTLMRDLIAEADGASLTTILHVEPGNPAKRLYERLGFVEGAIMGVYCEMRRAASPAGSRANQRVNAGG